MKNKLLTAGVIFGTIFGSVILGASIGYAKGRSDAFEQMILKLREGITGQIDETTETKENEENE